MVRLDTVLNSWTTAREDAAIAVENFPAQEFDFKPAEPRPALAARCVELMERPEVFFTEEITRMDGHRMTRMEMLQFKKEYELTHRAQLFMYLRLEGVVPATTRRRMVKARA